VIIGDDKDDDDEKCITPLQILTVTWTPRQHCKAQHSYNVKMTQTPMHTAITNNKISSVHN